MSFDAHGSVQGAPTPQATTQSVAAESTPAASSTPAITETTSQPAAQSAQTAAPEPVAYTPNYKFKVMDKEHEIPESFRSAIKDSASEAQAREIFEKAYGLDFVKPRFQELRTKYAELDQNHRGIQQGIEQLRDHYSRGDFDSFFKQLQIPQEKVLQWVLDKAQYNELPPEQRQVLDAKKAAETKAMSLERQQAEMQQYYEQQVTQAKGQMLQFALERPEVKQFAEAFNSRGVKNAQGQTLSLRDAIIERGELAWFQRKIDLSPEQAIAEVMALYGPQVQQTASGANPNLSPQGQAQVTAPQAKAKVIPNVGGKTSSPASGPKPRSIEDLKKLAQKFA